MIQASTAEIQAAFRFLNRIRFEKNPSPALRHVLVSMEGGELSLSVANDDLRLEYRIPDASSSAAFVPFLVPAQALRDASKGGRRGRIRWDVLGTEGTETLEVTVTSGTREVKTSHPLQNMVTFPARPVIDGPTAVLSQETIDAVRLVAPFASTDSKCRGPICGVRFSPEDGGAVVATDVRHMAMLPARVPDQPFLLPNSAVPVLGHDGFGAGSLVVTGPDAGWVSFRSGHLTCFVRVTTERFPDVRRVVPRDFEASATIREADVPPLITWLRSLKGASASVQLTWDRPGRVVFSERDRAGQLASVSEVPVKLDGSPPHACLKAAHLANALAIGNTLRFSGPGMPCVVTSPAGGTSAIAPLRMLQGA